jgi:UDP-glucuronate decarboxylase
MQSLKGDNITIYGDGSQSRSFCYVDDMLEGLIRLMDTDDTFIGPVNLGNPSEMTMLELADKVRELTKSASGITFFDLPEDDPLQRQPDINLAKKALNWEPYTPLHDGLEQTINYFLKLQSQGE